MSSGSPPAAGSPFFDGFIVDVLAKRSQGSFKLLAGATVTEAEANGSAGVRTNLSLACKVVIPNGGALVVDGGGHGSGTNHWLVIAPVALDARGNPIQLAK